MADKPQPTCGRIFHGATFDVCGLPRRHPDEDHRGVKTGVRWKHLIRNKTDSVITGLGDVPRHGPHQPSLFEGESRAS